MKLVYAVGFVLFMLPMALACGGQAYCQGYAKSFMQSCQEGCTKRADVQTCADECFDSMKSSMEAQGCQVPKQLRPVAPVVPTAPQ